MTAIRTDMVAYLRELMAGLATGDTDMVIEFCNTGSIKNDTESLLGRSLTGIECEGLLCTPEGTSDLFGERFGQVHMVAYNMKHTRQLCRTLLRQGKLEGIMTHLSDLLHDAENFAYAQ
jgi:hypothetical protein